MVSKITTKAPENGTYIFVVTFTDEDSVSTIPTALTWSLTDRYGNIINSREDVSITPAATINIVLSGDDLLLSKPHDNVRILLIEGTYDSDLGSDLPLRGEAVFEIENHRSI